MFTTMNDSDIKSDSPNVNDTGSNTSDIRINNMTEQVTTTDITSRVVHIVENDNIDDTKDDTEVVVEHEHDTDNIIAIIRHDDVIDKSSPTTTVTPLLSDSIITITTITPSKRMYLLSLIQIYQDLYVRYIIPLYKSMIWNITKSCRTIQSRSSSSHHLTSTSSSALSAIHIPIQRTFTAQRRLYYNNNIYNNNQSNGTTTGNSHISISSGTNNTLDTSAPTLVLCECDENGISITSNKDMVIVKTHLNSEMNDGDVPSLNEDIDIQNNNYEIDPSATTTGLRQRKGQSSSKHKTTSNTSISIEPSNTEKRNRIIEEDEIDQQQQQQQLYMIQLLLRSSSNGLLSKAPISLMNAQDDSIQLLQYITTILIHLQILIQKEICSISK